MKTIVDLRETLFDAMDKLKSGKMDAKEARALSDMAQVIINSAKVEVDYAEKVGGKGSGFLPDGTDKKPVARLVNSRV